MTASVQWYSNELEWISEFLARLLRTTIRLTTKMATPTNVMIPPATPPIRNHFWPSGTSPLEWSNVIGWSESKTSMIGWRGILWGGVVMDAWGRFPLLWHASLINENGNREVQPISKVWTNYQPVFRNVYIGHSHLSIGHAYQLQSHSLFHLGRGQVNPVFDGLSLVVPSSILIL